VRENNRRKMARIKSRRASARELREAKMRLKEIEQEFKYIPLRPETKRGEDREARYTRILRLRSMRAQFEAVHPIDKRPHANSILLSLVMIVSTLLFCACTGGVAYASLKFLTQKPDPIATANDFWSNMKTANSDSYATVFQNDFSPTLRAQQTQKQFSDAATQTDVDYGPVTNAVLTAQQVTGSTASLSYNVTRVSPLTQKKTTYQTTLGMELFSGAWTVSDLGATIDPTQAGAGSPTGTPSPTATKTH
jgi:hypothetical protein